MTVPVRLLLGGTVVRGGKSPLNGAAAGEANGGIPTSRLAAAVAAEAAAAGDGNGKCGL